MQSLSTSKLVIKLQGAIVAAAVTTSTARYGEMVLKCLAFDLSDQNHLGPHPESRSLASLAGFPKQLLLLGNLTKIRSLGKSLAVCIN